ncbi:MAG: hypothetical protein LH649_05720 [Pseudanabaena sp. CAN_BIN31]|nr:hypothetical protein [Pseudanabaena sp. CAN_BIN31]
MNAKIVSLSAVAAITVVFSGWFGWTTYQRSVYEGLLASAEEVTTKISNDSQPVSLEVLGARQKNISAAISSLDKIPPSSGDIYSKAQKRWGELQELKAKVTQMMENEQQSINSLAQAKALTDEASKNAKKTSLSTEEWKMTHGKYQEAIALLEKIPANRSVKAEANQNLTGYRKNGEVVLVEYRKRETVEKKKFEEEQRQAQIKEQERQAKFQVAMLERQAAIQKELLQQQAAINAASSAREREVAQAQYNAAVAAQAQYNAEIIAQVRANAEAQARYNAELLPYSSFEKNVDAMQRAGVNGANITQSISGAYNNSTTKLSPVEMTIK